ncbi:A kinase anchor protein 10, mitochondrial [Plakobranchus ocellatus]|uniref:A kinase anchor protein 10, mitochondrial n=1 Tax=Plakobranchus ocellatus TaxID=259542 RepID=A0AAV3Y423_9GAST|nr:A kinase anchor protein 10, mitochondrial [Plakobranchus ocellatus]
MPFFKRKPAVAEPQNKAHPVGVGLVRTPSNRSSKSTTSLPLTPNTPDSWSTDIGFASSFANGLGSGNARPQTLVLSESVLEHNQDLPVESLESPLRTSSRLSKTLLEVVRDKNALACFKAFMKAQRAERLIQFWCDAESFHASTLTRMRTHLLQSHSRKRRTESSNSLASETSVVKESHSDTTEASETLSQPATAVKTTSCDKLNGNQGISHCDQNVQNLSKPYQSAKASDETDQAYLYSERNTHKDQSVRESPSISSPCAVQNPHQKVLNTAAESMAGQSQTPSPSSAQLQLPMTVSSEKNDDADDHKSEISSPSQGDGWDPSEGAEASSLSSPLSPLDHPDELLQKLKRSVERDAVTIFSTYIAKDAPQPIGVDDSLRSEAISKICQENGNVDPECFVNCQRFVLNKLDSEYFQPFKDSAFHCRHQVHVLTSERVFLPDILFNENALCYFMEYIEQEGASDLMQVWLCASNFQQQLLITKSSYDPIQAQTDAMVIYDKYFSLQATNPVGFDDKLRFEIESNICREDGPLPDCFTKAKNIVLKMLEKNYFPNYLHSQIYHRYLSDLISTVQINEDIPQKSGSTSSSGLSFKSHRRSESDASSEHSFSNVSQGGESTMTASSARNTLLAVDTRRVKRSSNKSKLNIDGDFSMTMDMFNPDDLWKRPQANKLCLGSVTEMGQFVSDFDHETIATERRKASLGPALFKRKKEKEKEEEEMALRIAQIIISDVNTMTRTGETMADHKGS